MNKDNIDYLSNIYSILSQNNFLFYDLRRNKTCIRAAQFTVIFIPEDNSKKTHSKSSRSVTQPKEQKHVSVLYSVFEVNR